MVKHQGNHDLKTVIHIMEDYGNKFQRMIDDVKEASNKLYRLYELLPRQPSPYSPEMSHGRDDDWNQDPVDEKTGPVGNPDDQPVDYAKIGKEAVASLTSQGFCASHLDPAR